MMKTYIIFLSLVLTIACTSCNRGNELINKIIFNDNIENVQDSLLKITQLLTKIKDPVVINKGYSYTLGNLVVNNMLIDTTEIAKLDTIQAISNFSKSEKLEFIKLCVYLKSNRITSGYFDTYLGLWLFDYRYSPAGESIDDRAISLLNKKDIFRDRRSIKILDHKGMIYLLSFNKD
jgi:hypothetical protein